MLKLQLLLIFIFISSAVLSPINNLYFSLYADDKQIIENTLVNIGIRILHNKPFDFKGNFVFIDTYSKADEQKNPNFMQLDTRFKLYFLTAEEDLRIGNN